MLLNSLSLHSRVTTHKLLLEVIPGLCQVLHYIDQWVKRVLFFCGVKPIQASFEHFGSTDLLRCLLGYVQISGTDTGCIMVFSDVSSPWEFQVLCVFTISPKMLILNGIWYQVSLFRKNELSYPLRIFCYIFYKQFQTLNTENSVFISLHFDHVVLEDVIQIFPLVNTERHWWFFPYSMDG